MTQAKPEFSIVLPARNEAPALQGLLPVLRERFPQAQIVVVNDGSTDDTSAVCARHGVEEVRHHYSVGNGGAVKSGARAARGPVIVFMDADGQHPPEEMHKLLHALLHGGERGPCDLVIGSRFVATVKYRQTFARMVGIHFIRHLIKLLVGLWITDPTSGYRAANHRVIRAFAHWYPDDYPEPEVVLLLHRGGFRVREVQVEMHQRTTGVTSIPTLRGVFYVVKVATCLLLDMFRRPWPEAKVGPRRESPQQPPSPQTSPQPAAHPEATGAAGVPQP